MGLSRVGGLLLALAVLTSVTGARTNELHRTSGLVLWRLGGKQNDFVLGPGAHFAFQHDVRRHPDGSLTLFDDEAGPPDEATQSRWLVLALDEDERRSTVLREYFHSPPLLSPVLGSMQDLGGGHHFVGWRESSYFTEYDTSGNVVFDGHLATGTASYRALKQNWKGRLADLPAVAVTARAGEATPYAS